MSAKKKIMPAAPPSLVADNIFLRPASGDDIASTYHWYLMEEPQSLFVLPCQVKTASEAADQFKKEPASEKKQTFAVIFRETSTPVGLVGFSDYNHQNRSAELHLMIDPDERRKGFGQAAMKLLIGYLFRNRGLNKVYVEFPDFNEGAVAVVDKLGFKKDGTLRDNHFFKGEFHSTLIYSLLLYELDW